jgi:hypothetical protein
MIEDLRFATADRQMDEDAITKCRRGAAGCLPAVTARCRRHVEHVAKRDQGRVGVQECRIGSGGSGLIFRRLDFVGPTPIGSSDAPAHDATLRLGWAVGFIAATSSVPRHAPHGQFDFSRFTSVGDHRAKQVHLSDSVAVRNYGPHGYRNAGCGLGAFDLPDRRWQVGRETVVPATGRSAWLFGRSQSRGRPIGRVLRRTSGANTFQRGRIAVGGSRPLARV